MSGFFGVLQEDDSDDSSGHSEHPPEQTSKSIPSSTASGLTSIMQKELPHEKTKLHIPSYEDLSASRADEITVLEAVYGEEFRCFDGVWGCARLEVDVSPPDIPAPRIGCRIWYVNSYFTMCLTQNWKCFMSSLNCCVALGFSF